MTEVRLPNDRAVGVSHRLTGMLHPRLVVPLTALVVLLTGCTGGGGSGGSDAHGEPSPSPTGSAHVDLSGVPVPRGPLCDVVPEPAVEQALAGPVTGTDHYANGEEAELAPGLVDVAHEWGCVFEGTGATVARVWVFARPVSQAEAETLVRRARRGRDCTFPATLDFGSPGLTSVCEVQEGTLARARLEGLFGDTWVGCEVVGPTAGGSLVQRAEDWCTAVVVAAGASE